MYKHTNTIFHDWINFPPVLCVSNNFRIKFFRKIVAVSVEACYTRFFREDQINAHLLSGIIGMLTTGTAFLFSASILRAFLIFILDFSWAVFISDSDSLLATIEVPFILAGVCMSQNAVLRIAKPYNK